MAHHELGPGQCVAQLRHNLGRRQSLGPSKLRADPVNVLCPKGNVKSVGLNQKIAGFDQGAVGRVELPSYLNDPRPVVQIAQGRVPIPWQSGGFSVKYEVHGGILKLTHRPKPCTNG